MIDTFDVLLFHEKEALLLLLLLLISKFYVFCVSVATGEWWKADVNAVIENALEFGNETKVSDAFTINGQPGDLYSCSAAGIIDKF